MKNKTIEEMLDNIKKKFNKLSVQFFDNEVVVKVGIMRPVNAPLYKRTQADREREIEVNKMQQLLSIQSFQNLSQAIDYIYRQITE